MDRTIKETMQYRSIAPILLIALLVLAALTGCGTNSQATRTPQNLPEERTARPPQDASTQTQPAAATPLASGNPAGTQESTDRAGATGVTILLTNDVHGKVDPCG